MYLASNILATYELMFVFDMRFYYYYLRDWYICTTFVIKSGFFF